MRLPCPPPPQDRGAWHLGDDRMGKAVWRSGESKLSREYPSHKANPKLLPWKLSNIWRLLCLSKLIYYLIGPPCQAFRCFTVSLPSCLRSNRCRMTRNGREHRAAGLSMACPGFSWQTRKSDDVLCIPRKSCFFLHSRRSLLAVPISKSF